jgi:hypothetical protein
LGGSRRYSDKKRTLSFAASAELHMINRGTFLRILVGTLVCVAGVQLAAADGADAQAPRPPTIYYSFAPWDGTAYDIEIPLEPGSEGAKPNIRINIWGYPRFSGPHTIHFTGKEDPGGGPLKGDGIAHFQAEASKSPPERLKGTVSFNVLLEDKPVTGTYEFVTLDGKRTFKGSFQATWGNKPVRAIR